MGQAAGGSQPSEKGRYQASPCCTDVQTEVPQRNGLSKVNQALRRGPTQLWLRVPQPLWPNMFPPVPPQDVIQVSKKFLPSMAIGYSSSKLTLHVGDGFEFMKQNQDAFDVIITDSSDPMGKWGWPGASGSHQRGGRRSPLCPKRELQSRGWRGPPELVRLFSLLRCHLPPQTWLSRVGALGYCPELVESLEESRALVH